MNQKNLEGGCLIINSNFYIKESIISKDQCELIIKEADWSKTEIASVSMHGKTEVNNDLRKTDVTFAGPIDPVTCIMEKQLSLANFVRFKYDIIYTELVQIGKYDVGCHYDWHMDIEAPDENNHQRKLSACLMLSDPNDYEGGEFEIKDETILKLPQGSIIIFPSVALHRVLPVIKGTRYSAVAWAIGPSFR